LPLKLILPEETRVEQQHFVEVLIERSQ